MPSKFGNFLTRQDEEHMIVVKQGDEVLKVLLVELHIGGQHRVIEGVDIAKEVMVALDVRRI